MGDHHADLIRGMSLHVFNGEGIPEIPAPLIREVHLCPGALVYSYTLSVKAVLPSDPGEPVPNTLVGAILHLQDSSIEVLMHGCRVASIHADLSKGTDGGLRWPAFARLEVADGCNASLVLTYGHCA